MMGNWVNGPIRVQQWVHRIRPTADRVAGQGRAQGGQRMTLGAPDRLSDHGRVQPLKVARYGELDTAVQG
jgi:hypothetical protein